MGVCWTTGAAARSRRTREEGFPCKVSGVSRVDGVSAPVSLLPRRLPSNLVEIASVKTGFPHIYLKYRGLLLLAVQINRRPGAGNTYRRLEALACTACEDKSSNKRNSVVTRTRSAPSQRT